MPFSRFRFLMPVFLLAASGLNMYGVDGIVLIDQNRVLAGNVTPGDTPGFPVTISQPGSYRLSGNLTVPDINTTAIEVKTDNVTIDLNGFSILGPVNCTGGFLCGGTIPPGTKGYGILAGSDTPQQAYFNITIRNGTIQGMGADAIHIIGDSVTVADLHIRSNGFSGIVIRSFDASQTSLIVEHTTVQRNGSYGIKTYGGVITENTIDQSGNSGIQILSANGGIVSRNVISRSVEYGLLITGNTIYFGNTLVGNGTQVLAGVNGGQNICNGAACP
jgi:Right handed beta helix region